MDTKDAATNDDITIICKKYRWVINRALLGNASPVIAAMMESPMVESQTREIEVEEFDAEIVGRMSSFVERGEYSIKNEAVLVVDHEQRRQEQPYIPPPIINDILLDHVDMFRIADYYRMDDLSNYVVKRIERLGEHGWHQEGFAVVVKEVYDVSKPKRNFKSLRDALCSYTLQHAAQVMRESRMMDIFRTDHAMQAFVADLFHRMVQKNILAQRSHDQAMRVLRKENEDLRGTIRRLEFVIAQEKEHTENLIDAIPILPQACPGRGCAVQFPSNLSIKRDSRVGATYMYAAWTISCKVCGLQLKRCIGEWPVAGET